MGVIGLRRVGFAPGHQLRHSLHRQVRGGDQNEGEAGDHGQRNERLRGVIGQVRIDGRGDGHHPAGAHKERIAVSGLAHDEISRDAPASRRAVLDEELLTKNIGSLGADHAGENVIAAARCKGHHQPYGLVGIARRRIALGLGARARQKAREAERSAKQRVSKG